MNKFCKECADRNHNIGTTIDLEVSDLSDENNNNLAIVNERHDTLHIF